MDEDASQPEPEKPRFLLPEGCNGLIDGLRLQQLTDEVAAAQGDPPTSNSSPQSLPTTVALPDSVSVRELASALHLKPFQIIGSLMKINFHCSLTTKLDFETAAAVCSFYGVTATSSDE